MGIHTVSAGISTQCLLLMPSSCAEHEKYTLVFNYKWSEGITNFFFSRGVSPKPTVNCSIVVQLRPYQADTSSRLLVIINF